MVCAIGAFHCRISTVKPTVYMFAAVMLLLFATADFSQQPGCPSIKLLGPDKVTMAGQPMVFTVTLDQAYAGMISYRWSATGGQISSGQGTASIIVDSTGAQMIGAAVEIIGLPGGCPNRLSERDVPVTVPQCGLPPDEYGQITWEDERARLDNLAVYLADEPGGQAYFRMYVTEMQGEKYARHHAQRILAYFRSRWRKLKVSETVFVFKVVPAEEGSTAIWIFPKGNTIQPCEECARLSALR